MRVVAGEELAGDVLAVVDEDKGGKAVVEEEPVWSVLEKWEEVGTEVVLVVSTRSLLMEGGGEDITTDGVEGIRVPMEVIMAFVDVLP